MFVEERRRRIVEQVRTHGVATVDGLAATLNVSAPTVRADLAALEARRLLRRTHGGALPWATPLHEPPYAERAVSRALEKRRIGRAAARLIQPGETILLDAGTTTHEVGLALASRELSGVTVVTNALPTALALMDAPGIEVIVIGGQAQPSRRATLGPLAVQFLQPLRADRVFLGVSGVHAAHGLTAADFDAVQVKQALIAHANHVVTVADSEKVGQTAFACIGPVSLSSVLVTDNDLSVEAEAELREAGIVEIIRAA